MGSRPRNPVLAALESAGRLGQTTSLADGLQCVADTVVEIAWADSALVLLSDPEAPALRLVAASGVGEATASEFVPSALQGAFGLLFAEGRPVDVLSGKASGAEMTVAESSLLDGHARICAIRCEGRVCGAVAAARRGDREQFSDVERHAVDLIADLAGAAVSRARLYETLERKVYELSAIYELSQEVSSSLDVTFVVQTAVAATRHLAGAQICSLMLMDDEQKELRIAYARGLPDEVVRTTRIPVGHGISGHVALSGEPVLVRDIEHDNRFPDYSHAKPRYSTTSALCVPLKAGGRVTGVLNVNNKLSGTAFTTADMNLLTLFANQAALAIENARLHTATEERAVTDGLTGAYDHAFFHAHLDKVLARSLRAGEAVALIVLDIDEFKGINDTHGHPAGDAVLKGVAGALRKSVRDSDVVARCGGDEFAVTLPGAPPTAAGKVAERIRGNIDSLEFSGTAGAFRVGASIGVSSCPDDGDSRDVLLAAADRRLYAAKGAGGNKVVAQG